jgi:hypothetical protein
MVQDAKTTVVNIWTGAAYDQYIGRAGHGHDGYFGNPFAVNQAAGDRPGVPPPRGRAEGKAARLLLQAAFVPRRRDRRVPGFVPVTTNPIPEESVP